MGESNEAKPHTFPLQNEAKYFKPIFAVLCLIGNIVLGIVVTHKTNEYLYSPQLYAIGPFWADECVNDLSHRSTPTTSIPPIAGTPSKTPDASHGLMRETVCLLALNAGRDDAKNVSIELIVPNDVELPTIAAWPEFKATVQSTTTGYSVRPSASSAGLATGEMFGVAFSFCRKADASSVDFRRKFRAYVNHPDGPIPKTILNPSDAQKVLMDRHASLRNWFLVLIASLSVSLLGFIGLFIRSDRKWIKYQKATEDCNEVIRQQKSEMDALHMSHEKQIAVQAAQYDAVIKVHQAENKVAEVINRVDVLERARGNEQDYVYRAFPKEVGSARPGEALVAAFLKHLAELAVDQDAQKIGGGNNKGAKALPDKTNGS